MKNILTLILLLTVGQLCAQNYTIIHVIGKIYDTTTKTYLKSGTRLNASSKLKFESPSARAAVLSSQRGRYVIQKSGKTTSQSDLSYALASVLSPARGKLSTRAGGINNQIDFSKRFEGTTAWLGNTYQVEVSSTAYPIDEGHFFYVNYQYQNEEISKKLTGQAGSFTFDRSTFYAVDGVEIKPTETSDLLLMYYDVDKEESTEITPLLFSLVSNDKLRAIQKGLSDLNKDERMTALSEIIQSMYGKTTQKELATAIAAL